MNPTNPVTLEWGRRGASLAAERGDVLVVVDVLSFSSAVVTAIQQGAVVYPCFSDKEAAELALQIGAERAVHRAEAPATGRFSLSPPTFLQAEPGTRIALPSPNGATCCRIGRSAPALLVGSLLNAEAAARAAGALMQEHRAGLTVLACGERWQPASEDGDLRFALEDYLGAGAILSHFDLPLTPEARVCRSAFITAQSELPSLLAECLSGRELIERGYPQDVEHSARLNRYEAVPVLREVGPMNDPSLGPGR